LPRAGVTAVCGRTRRERDSRGLRRVPARAPYGISTALVLLRERCVRGLTVDRERAGALVRDSLVQATGLSPYLGHDVTAESVKEALATHCRLREVVLARGLVPPAAVARLLAPAAQRRPAPIDVALRRVLQHGGLDGSPRARRCRGTGSRGLRKSLSKKGGAPYSGR